MDHVHGFVHGPYFIIRKILCSLVQRCWQSFNVDALHVVFQYSANLVLAFSHSREFVHAQ